MDFRLSEEQRMLRDLVQRVAAERHTPEKRRAAIAQTHGFDRTMWQELGQLGLLSATLPESWGGLAAGHVATMLIMSALGRNLVNSPYLSTVICASGLLTRQGSDQQRGKHLPQIAGGECVVAYACAEADDDCELNALSTTAAPVEGGYRITGSKSLVHGFLWSDLLLIICRIDGGKGQFAAFLIPSNSEGISARHGRTIDGGCASELRFERLLVPASARIGEGDLRSTLEELRDESIMALCADATGSMSAMLEATTEYARTRKQFGKSISSFQALQHRMVDMLIACEQAISITHQAALKLDAGPVQRQLAVSAAKALVGKNSRLVAQAAIQIHGGIGITDELAVSHHFRRIELFNLQSGVVDWHTRRYAGLLDAGVSPDTPAA